MAKFDLEEIGSILEMLTKNDVREFKLERDADKLWLKRGSPEPVISYTAAPQPQYGVATPAQLHSAPPAPTQSTTAPASSAELSRVPEPVRVSNHKEVKSPMVGTFYRRPAVDAAPYVSVGDTVKKGQVLCIVEATKLMNEIESDVAGKIVEVCLEDAQMVEYGEVLFRVEPI